MFPDAVVGIVEVPADRVYEIFSHDPGIASA